MTKYRITKDTYRSGREVYYIEQKSLFWKWDRYYYDCQVKTLILKTTNYETAKKKYNSLVSNVIQKTEVIE